MFGAKPAPLFGAGLATGYALINPTQIARCEKGSVGAARGAIQVDRLDEPRVQASGPFRHQPVNGINRYWFHFVPD